MSGNHIGSPVRTQENLFKSILRRLAALERRPTGAGVFSPHTLTLTGDASGSTTIVGDAAMTLDVTVPAANSLTATGSSGVNAVIDTAPASARAVKWLVRCDVGADTDVTEILAVARGATVKHTEYGRMATNATLAVYDVTVAAGQIKLWANPTGTAAFTLVRAEV